MATIAPEDTGSAPHWTEIDWRPYIRDAQIGGRSLRYLDYDPVATHREPGAPHPDPGATDPDPVPANPALLLIHGLSGCWQWWLEVLPALGLKHRVIAVDLPGFGHSEQLPPPGAMTTQAACVAELADSLMLTDVTVAGHSMGGLVTLELARTRPDLVTRIILVNAGGVPMPEAQLRIVVRFIKASSSLIANPAVNRAIVRRPRARAILSKVGVGNAGAISPALAQQVVPLMNAPGSIDEILSAARAVRDTDPEAVHQPALLVWGENDPIITVRNAEEMAQRLPDAKLVLIPGTGHSPFIGKPDQFLTAVLNFTRAHGERA
jgi:pimeloyl-ACP methyl ester carboxylesterase